MKKLILSSIAMASLCFASGSALAVNHGITPADGLIINPISGKETTVWKLVGTTSAGVTAFQIHRNWVLASRHAAPSNSVFTNPLGSSQIGGCMVGNDLSEADYAASGGVAGPNDFVLCPLLQPLQIEDYGTYPSLVSSPVFNDNNRTKFGALLAYGRSGQGAQVAVVDFEGVPYGHQPVRSTSTVFAPHNLNGDSGGAAYWISPTSSTPAVVGVLTGYRVAAFGVSYLSDTSVNWIRSKIAAAGHTPPTTLTAAQNYTGPSGDPAPDLDSYPVISVAGPTLNVIWKTPAGTAGSTVTSYEVSLGANGTPAIPQTVQASAGNTTSFNTIQIGNRYKVCVRPANSVAPSRVARVNSAGAPDPTVFEINCATFNTMPPNAVGSVAQSSAPDVASGLIKVNLTWVAPAPVQDVTVAKYRITRSVAAPGGAKRTSTLEQTALSNNAFVQKGSTVCSSVAAVSSIGYVSAASPQVCTLAK